MARPVPPPRRSEVPAAELEQFDALGVELFGAQFTEWSDGDSWPVDAGYFGVLLHWPRYAENRRELSTIVRSASDLPGSYSYQDRQFISIVLHRHMKTNVVMSGHLEAAIESGVRVEAIDAIRSGSDAQLTDDERALATYIRQVVDGTVDEATSDKVEARLGRRGLVHYTVCITVVAMAIRQQQAFGLGGWSDSEIETILSEYRSGRRSIDLTSRTA
jgi:alkylhydroperoxidase family enzyme